MATPQAQWLRRLNPYCAQALSAAASLCQQRGHATVQVEHWLLKLLEPGDGDLPLLARHAGLDLDALWQALLEHLDNLARSPHARPALASHLQALVKHAWLHASLESDAASLRSQHLLTALGEHPELLGSSAALPLLGLARGGPWAFLEQQSAERPGAPWQLPHAAGPAAPTPEVLAQFTHDLVAQARAGTLDPVYGRESEIRQVLDTLCRRRKNNPILVGEPGVGKTAIAEGLALRLAEGDVPDALKGTGLLSLDLGLLQAGAGVKGEFERRLKQVIDAVQASKTPLLLFIDEAHTLVGAGNAAGTSDAANLLKPALARGELRMLGATTWGEYKQYFERDAALARRFQRVHVEEPTDGDATLMLRGLAARYAQHHKVHIHDAAVEAAVTLGRRYLSAKKLPDKGFDLLDTACARVRLAQQCEPEALIRLRMQHCAMAMHAQALQADAAQGEAAASERLPRLQQEVNALASTLAAAEQAWQQARPTGPGVVTVQAVAEVVSGWTNVPLANLLGSEQAQLLGLEARLGERVAGQGAALQALAERLRAARAGLCNEQAPQGVFLLAGPSGTGKTETAHALADILFGGALLSINLSEYQEAHTVSQLKGAPPGYVGYGQGGVLSEGLRQRPYCVVLLDEVEKAHRDVLHLFYQVFDRGSLRDGEGRQIDCRHCVFVLTSNLGSEALQQALARTPQASDHDLYEQVHPLFRQYLQPALLARMQPLLYRPLGLPALTAVAQLKLAALAQRLARHHQLTCHIAPALPAALAEHCLCPDSGARRLNSLLEQQVYPTLARQLMARQGEGIEVREVRLGYDAETGVSLVLGGGDSAAA